MSRWVPLVATSPSGKTLFVCRMCGRMSPTPDKECKDPPFVAHGSQGSCMLLEEVFAAVDIMVDGTPHATYYISGSRHVQVCWVDASGARHNVWIEVLDDAQRESLLKAIANGEATKQRAGTLAEPPGSTD